MTQDEKQPDGLPLQGKRILLIALPGYSDGIVKKMERMGAQVNYMHDKPNEGFLCKTLGRMKFRPYLRVIDRYYQRQLAALRDRDYDYVLAIRGEYTPESALRTIRALFPRCRLVLYMWDSIMNNRGIAKKWGCYDRVYTFDRMDYLNHRDEIGFLPLFYYDDLIPQAQEGGDETYAMSFIGTGHEDRIRIVKALAAQLEAQGMRCFTYFYLPHRFVYLLNKVTNPDFRQVRRKDVRFTMLPFREVYGIYGRSGCVVDIESSRQSGLTMRSIEILGLRRKFITTNRDIVHYDFYHPDNILVVDRKDCRIDPGFLKKPYHPLDERIYRKYSLGQWILNVLGDNNEDFGNGR